MLIAFYYSSQLSKESTVLIQKGQKENFVQQTFIYMYKEDNICWEVNNCLNGPPPPLPPRARMLMGGVEDSN